MDDRAVEAFTRQLATLVRSGVPLVRGLDVLARQERHSGLQKLIGELAAGIRAGGSLSEGMAERGASFDRLYVNMVRAGEAGGALEVVLERLAGFMEKAQRIRSRLKLAMIYPAIVTLVATAIVTVLMVLVVPRFEEIFAGLLQNRPLPRLTRLLLDASRMLQAGALPFLALPPVGFFLLRRAARFRRGRHACDRFLLCLPGLGQLILHTVIARFARTLGTLLAAGVPMLEALSIARDTCGNHVVSSALDDVHRRVRAGESVAAPLAATGLFPGLVTSMIGVGEETGALAGMLTRIADTFDEEVDREVAGLTALIESLMIVLMAVIVGAIVLALFLPLVGIIEHLA